MNLFFFDDDFYPASLLNFSYRSFFANNLLSHRTYVAIAYAPTRLDEARVVRLIVKDFTDCADAFAQGVVINVFSVPKLIQEFRATYESIAVLDQIR